MFARLLAGALTATTLAGSALAADFAAQPVAEPSAPSSTWSWTGAYLGAHLGSGLVSSRLDNPVGALLGTGSLYGDALRAPAGLAGIQGGFNWQMPNTNWVLGVEGELALLVAHGTNTCMTSDALLVSANCELHSHIAASLAGRAGFLIDPDQRALVYGKAGIALIDVQSTATLNYSDATAVASNSVGSTRTATGLLLGLGVEYALTSAISLKLEYDHYGLGSFKVPTNYTSFGQPILATSRPSFDAVKVGVNYHFGANDAAWTNATSPNASASSVLEFEIGSRYWYSAGRFQKDLGSGVANSSSLFSRLTFDDQQNSGEIFGKVESEQNVFLRGTISMGRMSTSKLHDEDWLGTAEGPLIPYSNTLSAGNGNSIYAIADVGYDLIRQNGNRLGLFAGYSYIYERHNALGCIQLTSLPDICGPGQVASGTLGISETDRWNALRLGVSGDIMLTDRLKLSADAAYLPVVGFSGTDNHWLRNLVIQERGHGYGTQLEAVLSYAVTDDFSIGAGARYWALWTDYGSVAFNGASSPQNLSYKMERSGVFLQGSYKFGVGG
ncbi:MAG: outer membrane beta-barrel protein [Ancalomicrobiaceae bacterium]|nr:outer membrane beta-barrel protein [Ancalomicrobiaceae bacterium]